MQQAGQLLNIRAFWAREADLSRPKFKIDVLDVAFSKLVCGNIKGNAFIYDIKSISQHNVIYVFFTIYYIFPISNYILGRIPIHW